MHPAVHGTELFVLLCVIAVVAPITAWAAVEYVRESFKVGREVE